MAKRRKVRQSTYGNDRKTGYVDPSDNNRTSSGISNQYPGIATMDSGTLRGWYEYVPTVGRYKGQKLYVQRIETGPAGYTGRGVDVNSTFARYQGLPQGNRFPTDSSAYLRYIGRKPPKGAKKLARTLYLGGGGGSGKVKKVKKVKTAKGSSAPLTVRPGTVDYNPNAPSLTAADLITQQQQAQQATGFTLPAEPWWSARRNVASATGVVGDVSSPTPVQQQGTLADQLAQLQGLSDQTSLEAPQVDTGTTAKISGKGTYKATKGSKGAKGSPKRLKKGRSPAKQGFRPKGVVKRSYVRSGSGPYLAAWIAAELDVARTLGWRGIVTSGYRSPADQRRVCSTGVKPCAAPGQSRHQGKAYPNGAADVSDAATLSRILTRMGSPLKWAGSKDPPHFSVPSGGSY